MGQHVDFGAYVAKAPRSMPPAVKMASLALMAIGIAAATFGFFTAPVRTGGAFIVNFMYWAGIAQGGMMLAVALVLLRELVREVGVPVIATIRHVPADAIPFEEVDAVEQTVQANLILAELGIGLGERLVDGALDLCALALLGLLARSVAALLVATAKRSSG